MLFNLRWKFREAHKFRVILMGTALPLVYIKTKATSAEHERLPSDTGNCAG